MKNELEVSLSTYLASITHIYSFDSNTNPKKIGLKLAFKVLK